MNNRFNVLNEKMLIFIKKIDDINQYAKQQNYSR